MTSRAAVEVHGVGKRYRQYRDESSLLRRVLAPHRSRVQQELWALRDIDFEVPEGETIGIIGRNGSGKTTLLRLLCGVSAPTVGRVRVRGPVAPLIGVGVGFNQELTGAENVLVNGRLLGMTAREVRERYDEIVAFSEIEEFIDVPVKFYSSGMFLRLAFAVAIHTHPRVMVVDEILAVGDVGFQAKCFDRMREIQDRGATVVVVTHNLQVLQRLTDRVVVLDHGRMLMDGGTERAIELYHEVMQRDRVERRPGASHDGATVNARLVDGEGRSVQQVRSGEPIRAEVEATFERPVTGPIVGFALERVGLGILYATAGEPAAYRRQHDAATPLQAELVLAHTPLLAGTYLLRVVLRAPNLAHPLAAAEPVIFHVSSDVPGGGTVAMDARFAIEGEPVPVVTPRLGSLG